MIGEQTVVYINMQIHEEADLFHAFFNLTQGFWYHTRYYLMLHQASIQH